jgi:ATP synthase protein I
LTQTAPRHSKAATFNGDFYVAEPNDQDRLKALEERIEQAKVGTPEVNHMKKDYSQAQHAWRMVTELVAGLLIGFVIGFGLDYAFGTKPIFLVIFIFLGFAAGVKTVIGSAQELQMQLLDKESGKNGEK